MDCSTAGLPVHHQLPEFTQTHVHWVSDVIQSSHPLSSPSPPSFNLCQYQGLSNEWLSTAGPCCQVRIWVNSVYLRQDSGPFSYSTVSLLVTLPCLKEKIFCLMAKSKQADYLNMTSLYLQFLHIILWQPPSLSVNTFVKSDILTAAIWMFLTGTNNLMKTLYKGELP